MRDNDTTAGQPPVPPAAWWRAAIAAVAAGALLSLGVGMGGRSAWVMPFSVGAIVVIALVAVLACWAGARRDAVRQAALAEMLGVDIPPGASVDALGAAIAERLAVASAAFAALERQHLQVLDASNALQAERRRYLRAERSRVASDVLLAAVVRDLPAALVVVDPRGRVCVWSGQAEQLLGVDGAGARGADFLARWVAPGHQMTLADVVERARVAAGPHEVIADLCVAGSAVVPVIVTLAVVSTPRGDYVGFTLRDRSEAERAATELALAQRLESVGRLAAGIAHEINTPLQFLGSSLEYLEQAVGVDLLALVGELVAVAEEDGLPQTRAADAAAACARRDLAYARGEVPVALEQARTGPRGSPRSSVR